MNRKQKTRLVVILSIFFLVSTAIGLVLYALKQNINLFYTPTQLLASPVTSEQMIRIGGYVKEHSVQYDASGQQVTFVVTDHKNEITVHYSGILPSLFREGQGVVITGKLTHNHFFSASEVLAKHDEKYMPWPLANELRKKT